MTVPSDLPRFPLLTGLYHVVVLDADKVLVANAGRSVVLSGEAFAGKVAPLLASLDGSTTIDELHSRFGPLAFDVVAGLVERGLVTEAAADASEGSLATQLTATAFPAAGTVADVAARISESTVAIAGCGPVGGMAAILLAKAGVGRVLVADTDDISMADVVVSAFVAPAHEGGPRVGPVLDACRQTGTAAHLVGSPFPEEILSDVDLAILEDRYQASSQDAAACLRLRVPYLIFAQDALEAGIGPLVMPGGVPCHRCAESRRLSQIEHLDEHLAYRRHRAKNAPRPDAFLAAHTSILAGLVATESLRALVGSEPVTKAGVVVVDLASGSFEREELLPIPGCTECDPATVLLEAHLDE